MKRGVDGHYSCLNTSLRSVPPGTSSACSFHDGNYLGWIWRQRRAASLLQPPKTRFCLAQLLRSQRAYPQECCSARHPAGFVLPVLLLGCEATDIGDRCSQVTPATLAGHSGACISKICEQVCQDRRCPNPGVLESDQTNLSEIGGTVIVKAGPEALGISVTKVKSAPVAIWAVYGQKTWSFVSHGRHMALVEDACQSVVC